VAHQVLLAVMQQITVAVVVAVLLEAVQDFKAWYM
jgi:hypothetical protein